MGIKPKLLFGKVMHARAFPARNQFAYRTYYLYIPLSQLCSLPIARNRPALLSFYDRDHGSCDGKDLNQWAKEIFSKYNVRNLNGDIILVCMPRVLGYVFNPVSFWLCLDNKSQLRAVLCEVNNTFGERHTYICAHGDSRPIKAADRLRGEKTFHVSPFLKREGRYEFRFDVQSDHIGLWVDYLDDSGRKQLTTSLAGTLVPMDSQALRKAFWGYPLVTLKTITLIHWQALKLLFKGIKYRPKPSQKSERTSATEKLKKM